MGSQVGKLRVGDRKGIDPNSQIIVTHGMSVMEGKVPEILRGGRSISLSLALAFTCHSMPCMPAMDSLDGKRKLFLSDLRQCRSVNKCLSKHSLGSSSFQWSMYMDHFLSFFFHDFLSQVLNKTIIVNPKEVLAIHNI